MLQLERDEEVAALPSHGFQVVFDRANGQRAMLSVGGLSDRAPGADQDARNEGDRRFALAPSTEVASLFLLSACNAGGRPDYSYNVSAPFAYRDGDGMVIELTSASSVWESKRYFLRCAEDRIE